MPENIFLNHKERKKRKKGRKKENHEVRSESTSDL